MRPALAVTLSIRLVPFSCMTCLAAAAMSQLAVRRLLAMQSEGNLRTGERWNMHVVRENAGMQVSVVHQCIYCPIQSDDTVEMALR